MGGAFSPRSAASLSQPFKNSPVIVDDSIPAECRQWYRRAAPDRPSQPDGSEITASTWNSSNICRRIYGTARQAMQSSSGEPSILPTATILPELIGKCGDFFNNYRGIIKNWDGPGAGRFYFFRRSIRIQLVASS